MAELTKLIIKAFDSPNSNVAKTQESQKRNSDTFTVDFNPNTLNISNKIEYDTGKEKGKNGGEPTFARIPPIEFTLEFVIDGTGVSKPNAKKELYVKEKIIEFREITGCNINGEIHRPNYLIVNWGTFNLECVLTGLNITYNLFHPDGSPLRAKVVCSFLERIGIGKEGRRSRLESADLTKRVIPIASDTLPLLCYKKYDDVQYYLQVARVNKLKTFRPIKYSDMRNYVILPPIVQENG